MATEPKGNDKGYQDYIRYLFFGKGIVNHNLATDPIIKFINKYYNALLGYQKFEALSEIMIREDVDPAVVWRVDVIMAKDIELYNVWLSRFKLDPATKFIDALTSSINPDTVNSLRYFILLLKHSDGWGAELMIEKTWELFMSKPESLLSHFSILRSESERIKSIFCEWKSAEERKALIHIYEKYASNQDAAEIVRWSNCAR